jgi:UDP-N-acetylglucosamine:LPS N-acetylglucosamine transferase
VENAAFFEKAGAAVVIPGGALLAETVAALAEDTDRRNAMAAASARMGNRDAADCIARAILAAIQPAANGEA